MNTLTVKLPDGTSESRKSDRPYTHAIVVVVTEARRARVLGAIEKTIVEYEAVIAANAPLVDLPAEIEAYAAAKERLAFLEEEVTEDLDVGTGKIVPFRCARWLGRSYRNEVGTKDDPIINSKGDYRGDIAGLHKRNADAALMATARGKVDAATESLVHARATHATQSQRTAIGKAWVHGWSQSAKNAAKAEQAARDMHPDARVYVTTDIAVHVPKARGGQQGAL